MTWLSNKTSGQEPTQTTYLPAESCWCLLSATLPCAIGAIDVVEAGNAALDAKVPVIVHAQLLTGQLLETVRVLGLQNKSR